MENETQNKTGEEISTMWTFIFGVVVTVGLSAVSIPFLALTGREPDL